jgi:hydroxyacylglutathione hydrolase
MFVKHFFVEGIAHSSYLLGDNKECLIVDPRRDIQIYIDAAKDINMKIKYILETHLHADFISGHLDLSKKIGATIIAPKSGKYEFPHKAVKEGDKFNIENLEISVLETPGHTPEHISYVIIDKSRGLDPVCIFCGDTLFVNDIGYPELYSEKAKELALKLYNSLHKKIFKLPDFCEIYPTHGKGFLYSRTIDSKFTSTIGYEKKFNQALVKKDKGLFINSLTTNLLILPNYFKHCSTINRKGDSLINKVDKLKGFLPIKFNEEIDRKNTVVLDIRSYDAFGGQHIPSSYNIDFGGNFAVFAGWIIQEKENILLISESQNQAQEASIWLHRVGLDNIIGFLEGGMFSWYKAGLPTEHINQLSVQKLHEIVIKDSDFILVDVRTADEFGKFFIKGAINIPVQQLQTRYEELDKGKNIVLICKTGHRSSLGASILKQYDFQNVYNVAGGITGYINAGYEL